MKKVYFMCVENAGRSQMAEAFANFHGKGKIMADSGGTKPSHEVNPTVVQVMREKGIDLSENTPKPIDLKQLQESDVMITMGCGAEGFCPAPLLERVIDWNIEDPKGKPIEKVLEIRDEIERKVLKLIKELSLARGNNSNKGENSC
jgi:protein-tyrosine-phosphatase